jgi:AraC family transcriptional regulator
MYGTPLQRREFAGFEVTEARYEPSATVGAHEHEHSTITIVVDGVCREQLRRGAEDLTAASVLIKPPGVRHRNDVGREGSRAVFIAPSAASAAAPDGVPWLVTSVAHLRSDRVAALGRRIRAELWDEAGGDSLVAEESILEILQSALQRPALRVGPAPSWLERTRQRLADDFVTPPSIWRLAEEAGVHPTYLGRAFCRHYGVRPGQFVHRMRIDWAAGKLAGSTTAIATIAIHAGFADQSHFGRIFKRFTGLSPAAYRRAWSGGSFDDRPSKVA